MEALGPSQAPSYHDVFSRWQVAWFVDLQCFISLSKTPCLGLNFLLAILNKCQSNNTKKQPWAKTNDHNLCMLWPCSYQLAVDTWQWKMFERVTCRCSHGCHMSGINLTKGGWWGVSVCCVQPIYVFRIRHFVAWQFPSNVLIDRLRVAAHLPSL